MDPPDVSAKARDAQRGLLGVSEACSQTRGTDQDSLAEEGVLNYRT